MAMSAMAFFNSMCMKAFSLMLLLLAGCFQLQGKERNSSGVLKVGAAFFDRYVPALAGKKVGVLINNNALIEGTPILDTLLNLGVRPVKRFGPEKNLLLGGGRIETYESQFPFVLLYGDKPQPLKEDMEGIEMMLIDVQDLGLRFYIYLSTLHHVMQACANQGVPVILLDRPNPLPFLPAGPLLDSAYESYLGVHPVPLVHGMTLGEYAQMINGEKWLKEGKKCELTVIPMENYHRSRIYELNNAPFPNLNSREALLLYPTLGLFDGTVITQGRGTDRPFRVLGHPSLEETFDFYFIPKVSPGKPVPVYVEMRCYGLDLSMLGPEKIAQKGFSIEWLWTFYHQFSDKSRFFNVEKFDKLVGSSCLRKQIIEGQSIKKIEKSWRGPLKNYGNIRKKYLIYKDFDYAKNKNS